MKLSLFQNLYFSESVSAIYQAAETRSVFLCFYVSNVVWTPHHGTIVDIRYQGTIILIYCGKLVPDLKIIISTNM